jgi:hypothetical protein
MNCLNRDWSKISTIGPAFLIFCVSVAGPTLCVPSALAAPQQARAALRTDADIETELASALAQSPQLQGQHITAATIQGDVTLSGSVQDEATRQLAQQIAAGVHGVRSVENNLTVGSPSLQQAPAAPDQEAEQAPPPPPPYDQGTARPDDAENQQNYPSAQQQNYPPAQQQNYPDQNYPSDQQQQNYPPPPQTNYPAQQAYQLPSGPVTIPSGTLLNVRTTELLDAHKVQAGTFFQATIADNVYQGNVLAIPRGAVLTGQVTGVKKPGDLAGKAGLQLQFTSLSLGGQTYALTTDGWTGESPGKGGYSAGNTAGGAALGAVIGAIAGGGPGAAIGAIAGGATGLAASAATKGPQVVVPPESVLSVHLTAPLTVNPVSYQEVQRLAASVPQQPRLMRRPVYVYGPYAYGYPYPYPYYRPYYYYPRY